MVQNHLSYQEMTNLGCFYTPEKFVDKIIQMIKNKIPDYQNYTFLDSSCGYGSFLKSLYPLKCIGCDIDPKAIKIAKSMFDKCEYYNLNSLYKFNRKSVLLSESSKVVIVGNPPYNDTTSRVKNDIKNNNPCEIDEDLKTRDLGISFMLSYNKFKADYVAILHPLSYMIKQANYKLLQPFFSNYELLDHCIINSQEFSMTSKSKGFPIILAIYKRNKCGISYKQILNMEFKTFDNNKFNLKHDYIKNYISKYPIKDKIYHEDDVLFFTMRDINALNRSRTFIQDKSENSIIVDMKKFAYYCYVDVFKDYIKEIPYYFGNCDVFINNFEFNKIKDVFITRSLEKHPWLQNKNIEYQFNNNYLLIDEYFSRLINSLIC